MIARVDDRDNPPAPFQPRGWPINAHINVANQARADAASQRQRVEQLERRNRRMRSALASSLALMTTFGFAMLALGLLLGYSVGVGLIGLVR